ncbi:MAG: ABC transporter permease [Chloroflexi bacterium]|nr:ABC transporter permease [Chloroflexota bacterium]
MLARILPSAKTATAVGSVLLFPMMFLSGATLPRQLLSETIQMVAKFLPLTHVVTLIQSV